MGKNELLEQLMLAAEAHYNRDRALYEIDAIKNELSATKDNIQNLNEQNGRPIGNKPIKKLEYSNDIISWLRLIGIFLILGGSIAIACVYRFNLLPEIDRVLLNILFIAFYFSCAVLMPVLASAIVCSDFAGIIGCGLGGFGLLCVVVDIILSFFSEKVANIFEQVIIYGALCLTALDVLICIFEFLGEVFYIQRIETITEKQKEENVISLEKEEANLKEYDRRLTLCEDIMESANVLLDSFILLPQAYKEERPLTYIAKLIYDGRAEDIKQAIELYEDDIRKNEDYTNRVIDKAIQNMRIGFNNMYEAMFSAGI